MTTRQNTLSAPAVPEPNLTQRELVTRAEELRPKLIERQAETEALTFYPESTHQDLLAMVQLGLPLELEFGGQPATGA